ncbi:MAG: J domain-containing protein [Spirulinaceae cyanobacterium]
MKHGLFQYDLTDHHAILGVAVTSDPGAVRKRYLKLARLLHPDSLRDASEAEKRQANELLSKLVNPAYEVLKGKTRNEHQIILEQTGKRLASEGGTPSLNSEIAQSYLKSGGDPGSNYNKALQAVAKQQYKSIKEAIATIETLSELNLVYLMKQGGKGVRNAAAPKATASSTASGPSTAGRPAAGQTAGRPGAAPPPPPAAASPVERYVARAQEYIQKNNFAKAVLELRDGLKLDPQNSTCHALLGMAYLKQDQVSMAKVHVTKALQSNPKEPVALQCKAFIEKKLGKPMGGSAGSNTSKSSKSSNKSSKPSKSQNSGRFGGLFGKK